ncbi:MAG: hypothetical protein RL591_99 [Planctomycetota bacterium]
MQCQALGGTCRAPSIQPQGNPRHMAADHPTNPTDFGDGRVNGGSENRQPELEAEAHIPHRPVRPASLGPIASGGSAEPDVPPATNEKPAHASEEDPHVAFDLLPDPPNEEPRGIAPPPSPTTPQTPRNPVPPAAPPMLQPPHAADDAPNPCAVCGYDLRGSHGRPACPECGTPVPLRRNIPMAKDEQFQLRADVVRIWNSLAFLSLVPIALLSPVPCLPCFGIVAAVALATAPGFRLAAIRNLDILPDTLRDGVRRERARFNQTQLVEGGVALLICGYAAIATFGLLPAKFAFLYRALILAWWCIACAGLVAQTQYAEALRVRAGAADPDSAAQAAKARRTIRVAFVIAVIAAFGYFLASVSPGAIGDVLSVGSLVLFAVASVVFILAALEIRGHAEATGVALYSSPALAKAVLKKTVEISPSEAALQPPPNRTPATPPKANDSDDDAPIPLA